MRISEDFLKVAKRESTSGWARAARFWDTILILGVFAAFIIWGIW